MKLSSLTAVLLLAACTPPTPPTPSLLPETAAGLLQNDNKAKAWLMYVKKHDATCEYKLDIPDQSAHPAEIDIDHIVYCGNRPSPKEYDASVQFVYDKAAQHWVILRFSS